MQRPVDQDFWDAVDRTTSRSHVIFMIVNEYHGFPIGDIVFKVYRRSQLASLKRIINLELCAFQEEDDSLTFVANGSLTEYQLLFHVQQAGFKSAVYGSHILHTKIQRDGEEINISRMTYIFENKDLFGVRRTEA